MQGGAELGRGQSTPHSPALPWAARPAREFGTLPGGSNKAGGSGWLVHVFGNGANPIY